MVADPAADPTQALYDPEANRGHVLDSTEMHLMMNLNMKVIIRMSMLVFMIMSVLPIFIFSIIMTISMPNTSNSVCFLSFSAFAYNLQCKTKESVPYLEYCAFKCDL